MSVKSLLQALLIHVMADKSNTTSQNEQRVDRSNVYVFLCLLTTKLEKRLNCKIFNYLITSYLENAPQFLSMSTKQVAMTPSTLRIKLGFLLVVIFSTSNAYSSNGFDGKFSRTNSLMILTRMSGLLIDFTR